MSSPKSLQCVQCNKNNMLLLLQRSRALLQCHYLHKSRSDLRLLLRNYQDHRLLPQSPAKSRPMAMVDRKRSSQGDKAAWKGNKPFLHYLPSPDNSPMAWMANTVASTKLFLTRTRDMHQTIWRMGSKIHEAAAELPNLHRSHISNNTNHRKPCQNQQLPLDISSHLRFPLKCKAQEAQDHSKGTHLAYQHLLNT